MPIRPGPGQEPRPPQQYVKGYAPPGGLVDAIAPGRVPTSRPVNDMMMRPIRGNYQLPEGASMNTYASVPSNGLINSAHHSISYSQRKTPSAVCENVYVPDGHVDSYGYVSGAWATVCRQSQLLLSPQRIIAESATEFYAPGGHFPKTT